MQLLIFKIGDISYGVNIESIQSVEQNYSLVTIPNTAPEVVGIIHLREKILAVYSLSKRFGVAESEAEHQLIIVAEGSLNLALEVEEVVGMMTVPEEELIPMPQMVCQSEEFSDQVAKDTEGLIILLNINHLITMEETKAIEKAMKAEEYHQ
ncbi:MAG: chemotaxis protein CheW [Lachnospiraceae bacterium]